MKTETTIVLADDHPIFRGGLRQLIEREAGWRVVAEADDGQTALAQIEAHAPDVAVLDLDMPELDGFEVARRARAGDAAVKIIILTLYKDALHFQRAQELGVRGYLVKEGAANEVVDCLRTVVKGGEYVSPALASLLFAAGRRAATQPSPALAELTPTERRVLLSLAGLKTTKEIAATLGISPRTVDNHRAHICAKLNLQGVHALTKFALQHKDELSRPE